MSTVAPVPIRAKLMAAGGNLKETEEIICGSAEVERIARQIRAAHAHPQAPTVRRRLPVGAEPLPSGGVHFRVWAPRSNRVAVELWEQADAADAPAQTIELQPEANGYFGGIIAEARPGMAYRFRLDAGSFPDPASRFQPHGPHGPSEIVDFTTFRWTDANWRGVAREGQVIYELHIGTFTPEGTWQAAIAQLPALKELGVTLLEVMPVADFCGRFGWGYDGVNLFAPTRLYGRPDDMRAFVNRAHELGLGVILDVVYNHFGPDGNYVGQFSPDYFSSKYKNEWGEALNFDGENSSAVREFFIANAACWIEEFHLDGLRLDATQQIFDDSPTHILTEVGEAVRRAAKGRGTFVVNENESQHTRLVRDPSVGGCGLDALWNDDFHHAARVALTGRNEAYYSDYRGTPQEIISAIKWGYLYQGQRYEWQDCRRGTPALDLPPTRFVSFLQNHDQVANSLRGQRLHQLTTPGRFRAMTTLLLLGPQTPMLFMGQEFAASAPFVYFADHNPELAPLVRKGRLEFLQQFKTIASPDCTAVYDDPAAEATFRKCVLDLREREANAAIHQLHRDLLRLRRDDPVFSQPQARGIDGAVLDAEAFVLRIFSEAHGDRLLLINLGRDLNLRPASEPLLAPPCGHRWQLLLSTEQVCYGGSGILPPEDHAGKWHLAGHSASVLIPTRVSEGERGDDGKARTLD